MELLARCEYQIYSCYLKSIHYSFYFIFFFFINLAFESSIKSFVVCKWFICIRFLYLFTTFICFLLLCLLQTNAEANSINISTQLQIEQKYDSLCKLSNSTWRLPHSRIIYGEDKNSVHLLSSYIPMLALATSTTRNLVGKSTNTE